MRFYIKSERIIKKIMYQIKIYTDGSCLGNPGNGGYCALLQKFQNGNKITEVSLVGNQTDTTNNRMEMMAVLKAISFLNLKNISDSEIQVYSDSNLVVSTLSKGWKRKANLDIWQDIDIEIDKCVRNYNNKISWNWVKAHNNHPENEYCDTEARKKAMEL